MGHDKLRKFAENETFKCLLQPSAAEALADGFFNLRDHEIKGRWNERMFDAPRPIVLELGCGKGEYTIDLAQRHPDCNYIGVDIKGARLWKGAKYATEHALGNVAFLRTRIEFITAYFAPGEVSEIWLTFSDPQFRSENSRLTSPLFLERYRSFMRPGGIVHLKTDSMFLHMYSRAVAACNGLRVLGCTEDLYATPRQAIAIPQANWVNSASSPGVCTSLPDSSTPSLPDSPTSSLPGSSLPTLPDKTVEALYEVQTFYEKMFLEQGYKITYLSFVIDHYGPFVHPVDFDEDYWRSVEGPRLLFGHDSAETRRRKLHPQGE